MKHSKNQRNDSINKAPLAEGSEPDDDEVVALPIDGILDLHTFHPKEIKELVPDYLDECYKKGILEVRIIHGKGTGTLRTIVHSILKKNPLVKNFQLGGHGSGSWGATLVTLVSKNP
jgi:dsDNA-specific endonuclease/ATPase MutS2